MEKYTEAMIIDPRSYIHMSPDGDDMNSGSEDEPVKSLQRALDLSTAYNKNIIVKPGTYTSLTAPDWPDKIVGGGYSGNNYESLLRLGEHGLYSELATLGSGLVRIVGEPTLYLDLSNVGNIHRSVDRSLSYTSLTFTDLPGWQNDLFVGKLFSYIDASGLGRKTLIIGNRQNQIDVLGEIPAGFSNCQIWDMPEFVFAKDAGFNSFYLHLSKVSFSFIKFNLSFLSSVIFINEGSDGETFFEGCCFDSDRTNTLKVYVGGRDTLARASFKRCLFNRVSLDCDYYGKHNFVSATYCGSKNVDGQRYAFGGVQELTCCCAFGADSFFYAPGYSENKYRITNVGGNVHTWLATIDDERIPDLTSRTSIYFGNIGEDIGYSINSLVIKTNTISVVLPVELFTSSSVRGTIPFYKNENGATLYVEV